ncbi:MAG: type IX secretion system membrane protein PorP/SprF [Flavobacteriales bacterium]|nr:type IX secretion system membrane protein PorP/SprF [Flavobacteriales bacterium]
MKKQLTFLAFLGVFQLFGQNISYLENIVLFSNPAATVKYKFFTNTGFGGKFSYSQGTNFRYQLQANNYSKIQVKNFQFGAGFTSFQSNFYRSGSFQLDVNYTFYLSRFLKLSVGVGGRTNKFMYPYENVGSNFITGLNSGIMFEGKKWRAGLAYSNINRPEIQFGNDTGRIRPAINLYGEYRFTLNESWSLTPQLHLHNSDVLGFGIGATAYYKRLQFGGSYGYSRLSPFIGYSFKEKYMLGIVSRLNLFNKNNPFVNSQLNFSYIIPRKKEKTPPPLPSF